MVFQKSARAMCAVIAFASASTFAQAPKDSELTIILPITVVAGKPTDDVRKALVHIAGVIRKQPGLIDEYILESSLAGAKPSHLHVMRWKDRKSWEGTFADGNFHKALAENKGLFTVDNAGFFKPMK